MSRVAFRTGSDKTDGGRVSGRTGGRGGGRDSGKDGRRDRRGSRGVGDSPYLREKGSGLSGEWDEVEGGGEPHIRYSQQGVSNLRRCVVSISDSVLVTHLNHILPLIRYLFMDLFLYVYLHKYAYILIHICLFINIYIFICI
jgi:hypothetical protein